MSTVGPTERATQDRVVALFHDRLDYTYLGNWKTRSPTSAITTNGATNALNPMEPVHGKRSSHGSRLPPSLCSKRSASGVVAMPSALRYPSATELCRSAASTAWA